MNDHELDLALADMGVRHLQVRVPPTLRDRVHAVPLQTPQPRSWLPQLPKWRFGSMFSATKVLVAAVIVALFGGLVLSTVVTEPSDGPSVPAAVTTASASPEPTTTAIPTTAPTDAPKTAVRTDILPGVSLTVEKVKRGVFRILDDGAGSDLGQHLSGVMTADTPGDVWPLDVDRTAFRLGGNESIPAYGIDSLRFTPDGTLWGLRGADRLTPMLVAFDGSDWVEQPMPDWEVPAKSPEHHVKSVLDATPDGRLWLAISRDPMEPLVAVREDGEWKVLPSLQQVSKLKAHIFSDLVVAPGGTVWLVSDDNLLRYGNGAWRLVEPKVTSRKWTNWAASAAVGRDGTLWLLGANSLVRNDGAGWKVWEGIMAWDCAAAYCERHVVGTDGKLWLWFDAHVGAATRELVRRGIIREPKPRTDAPVCDDYAGDDPGVLSFDGKHWHQYLAGHCVSDVAVARDGTVWVTDTGDGRDESGAGLYVITPEAVAAAE